MTRTLEDLMDIPQGDFGDTGKRIPPPDGKEEPGRGATTAGR